MSCDSRITERKWLKFQDLTLTANGTSRGLLTVENTEKLRVGQRIRLVADTLPELRLKVNRVISSTQFYVGPIDKSVSVRKDVSSYTIALNSKVKFDEQSRTDVDPKAHGRAMYEEEPIIAQRSVLVDKYGCIIDKNHPIDVNIASGVSISAQLTHLDDYPNSGDEYDSVRIGDGTEELLINPDGSINVIVSDSSPGTPVSFTEEGTISDTTETKVAEFTAISKSKIFKFLGEAKTLGVWRIYDGDTVGSSIPVVVIRTSEFIRTAMWEFSDAHIVLSSNKLSVSFEAERYRTKYLTSSSSTFVRLEGTRD